MIGIDALLDAQTFGDARKVLREVNKQTPFDLPPANKQLARIVGSIFTIVHDGDFAAPTAGRLMHEVAVGFIRMCVDDEVTYEFAPLHWEMISQRDLICVRVSAMLMALKPNMPYEEWCMLGGRLYSYWASNMSFPEEDMEELERLYLNILKGESNGTDSDSKPAECGHRCG